MHPETPITNNLFKIDLAVTPDNLGLFTHEELTVRGLSGMPVDQLDNLLEAATSARTDCFEESTAAINSMRTMPKLVSTCKAARRGAPS
jgi:hypothetical protein